MKLSELWLYEGQAIDALSRTGPVDLGVSTLSVPLPDAPDYYYALRVVDTDGVQSALSSAANLSTFSGTIPSQWQLLSVPVGGAGVELSQSVLYGFEGNYIRQTTAIAGQGYWGRSPTGESYTVFGSGATSITRELQAGWSLIGGPVDELPTEEIIDEDGILTQALIYTVIDDDFVTVDRLEPYKGYWIFASQAGQITLALTTEGSSAAKAAGAGEPTNELSPAGTVSFSGGGATRTMALMPDGADPDGRLRYLLPPLPPEPTLDVRTPQGLALMESPSVELEITSRHWPVIVALQGEQTETEPEYIYRISARDGQ
ncbi:MAG: hypothetical protein WD533_04575, partial [Dehalococcoidia bacterium]